MSFKEFKAARDFLLAHGGDYETAYRDFRWPVLTEFNWALDWFDGELATTGPDRLALRILGDKIEDFTFGELAAASSRLANGLRGLGATRGDRLLLMLGNVGALWQTMLAAMKLGLVVIPATTLLAPKDIEDRLARGKARFIVAEGSDAAKFEGLAKGVARIALGDAPA